MDVEERGGQRETLTVGVVSSEKMGKRKLVDCFGTQPTSVNEIAVEAEQLGGSRWHYDLEFPLKGNLSNFFYVVDRFCKLFEGDAYINTDILEDEIEEIVEADHQLLRVDNFALGAWMNISGFIERFSSIPTKHNSSKIAAPVMSFFHHRRYLELCFKNAINGFKNSPVYKLMVNYNDIERIVIKRELRHSDAFCEAYNRKDPMDVYLHVKAISVYKWASDTLDPYDYFDGPWIRQIQFGSQGNETFCNNVGQMRVLKFKLEPVGGKASDAIYSLIRTADAPFVFANVKRYQMPKNVQAIVCDKSNFNIQYALSCLHSISPETAAKATIEGNHKEIQQLLAKFAAENESVLLDTLYEIYYEAKKTPLIDFHSAISRTFKKGCSNGSSLRSSITQANLPKGLFLVKKAVLCPSKIIIEPPTVVRGSSLLSSYADCLMLVDIRDDDLSRLQLDLHDEAADVMKKSIGDKIRKGLRVAGKTYHFLGASKAHLNDFGFWAYAHKEKNCKDTMDDVLRKIGVVGQLSDKMKIFNLLATESMGSVSIDASWVTDETGSTDVFKIGIGRISENAHKHILSNCGIEDNWQHPAIRVVHGGRVGTLTLDPTLEGHQIIYRVSQRLYSSSDDVLYLIEVNNLKPAVIDMSLHSVLSSKRKHHEELFGSNHFIPALYSIMDDCVFHMSSDVTHLVSKIESILPDAPVYNAKAAGYAVEGDQLFREALRCSQLKRLGALKDLKLDIDKMFEVMPVLDEHDVLGAGEVYVQFIDNDGELRELNEYIVVCRTNAIHPSELRKFKAVSNGHVSSKLRHLHNCIVFSAKGDIPPLSMLTSGASYAEGNNVVVIANPSFIFEKEDTAPTLTVLVGDPIPPDEKLLDHVVNVFSYLSYNPFEECFNAYADMMSNNAYAEMCVKIGAIRRLVDDFLFGSREVEPLKKPPCYPDFLRKLSDTRTYCSNRSLGLFSRKMRLVDLDHLSSVRLNEIELRFQNELEIDGCHEYKKAAAKDLNTFKNRLRAISSLYGVSVEEILTGTIYSLSESHYSPSRVTALELTVRLHVKHLRALCERQFERGMKDKTTDDRIRKMSAYVVESRRSSENGGYALPWMLPNLMLELINATKLQDPEVPTTTLHSKIVRKITINNARFARAMLVMNVSRLIERWAKHNKQIFLLSRESHDYFAHKLNEVLGKAFDSAWKTMGKTDEEAHPIVMQDARPFFTEILREMLREVSAIADSPNINQLEFVMSGIQALIMNTFVKFAGQVSVESFLQVDEIIRSKVVDRKLLFVINYPKDTAYVRATQNALYEYEEHLQRSTGCQQVNVRLLPRDEEAFEEVTARGEWFAVENLENMMLLEGYRQVIVNLFARKHNMRLRQGHDEYA